MIEVIGAIFIIVLGMGGHFFYEWSGHNKLLGYFVAVNESTFEHIKLIIGPSLLWLLVEIHLYHGNMNLPFAKFASLGLMILLIPSIFYAYQLFTKKPILIVDIISFIVTVIVGQLFFHFVIQLDVSSVLHRHVGYLGIFFIFLQYIMGAYTPFQNFIYKDPITKKYGVEGHSHEEEHHH